MHLGQVDINGEEAEAEEGEEESYSLKRAGKNGFGADDVISMRNKFVESKIQKAISEGRSSHLGVQTSSVLEERKRVIKEFYKRILSRPKCDNCGMYSPKFRKDGYSKIFEQSLKGTFDKHNKIKGGTRQTMIGKEAQIPKAGKDSARFILSEEVRNILSAVFQTERTLTHVLFHVAPITPEKMKEEIVDMFFIRHLVVPPTRFRLPSQMGEEIHANPQNDLLAKVLETSLRIRDLNERLSMVVGKEETSKIDRKAIFSQLMNSLVTIQDDLNAFIDNTKAAGPSSGKVPLPGIKQVLEKKEGLFRMNMMGKRVNYAARSVISPDPNIETNEIGLPPVFAVKLTYPEPVTAHNFHELRQAVINGPNTWPGATQIQNEDGSLVSLESMTQEQRIAVANQLMTPSTAFDVGGAINKKVFRHIKNRDIVLMNRQPTLHKASMMGHRVRVLPKEKTLRLHYANTGAYNADFDGDEMNLHFPQNENARSEAYFLANTDSQYLTPTSGKPLRGLIQDHISAGVWLTNKDTYFTREQYQQLIYGSVRPEDGHTTSSKIITIPPAIIKPRPMWTGKQVITTVLLNITPTDRPGLNLVSKNKIKNEYWGKGSLENEVVFRNGHLLSGILDKSQYGATDYGFVHSVYEVYGPDAAGRLLSVLGRLFTKYVMSIALTCGMDDLRLTDEGNKWRRTTLAENTDVGLKAAVEVTNLPAGTKKDDPELLKRLEEILRDDNKLAVLDAITQSKVNAVTSSVVGQCIPEGTEKRFPQNNMQSMALSGAKGSNVNVSQIMCMLGQQALEGRRVPVMVSGKTLPAFKPFETEAIAGGYISGRFFSGIRLQEYYFHCMAGREGLIDTAVKTASSGYLQRCLIKQLEGVHTAYDNTVRDSDGTMVQFMYGGDAIDVTKESHLTQFDFCVNNFESLVRKYRPANGAELLDTDEAPAYVKRLAKGKETEPVLSQYNPGKYLGSISDIFHDKLEAYVKSNKDMLKKEKESKKEKKAREGMRFSFPESSISPSKFRSLMHLKYMQSIVNPGESVGIIASQSIGEPSTQMTLNTFHFAGHGAANVTLGIPRMREIIMTASAAIKTPQMSLPLLPHVTNDQAEIFCKATARIMLSELTDHVTVTERQGRNEAGQMVRSYKARLIFYARDEYESEYDISQRELEGIVSNQLLEALEAEIRKEIRRQKKTRVTNIAQAVGTVESESTSSRLKETNPDEAGNDSDGEDDVNSDDEDEGDHQKQAVSYEKPDEEEQSLQKKALNDDEDDDDSDSDDEKDNSKKERNNDNKVNDSDKMDIDEPTLEKVLSSQAKERQQEVVSKNNLVTSFDFDDELGEWCEFELELGTEVEKLLMVNIVEKLCQKVVVREVKNIGRCIKPADSRSLVTEGVNFQAMWEEDSFLDINGITSNDVSAVLKTYGVEAARATIVNEINRVFETYAIAVNKRHLYLIADMMTREGTYLAFNRQGIDSGTSPFMKMSFETTCKFLTESVLSGDRDSLNSPSSRIVTGKVSKVGTGSFDVLVPVN